MQTLEPERLDHFIVLGRRHLNYLIAEFADHYHTGRSHQDWVMRRSRVSPGTGPPIDSGPPDAGEVAYREHIGGLLKRYFRHAAAASMRMIQSTGKR